MAARSIGFPSTRRRPWERRSAVIGTDAPVVGNVVEVRIATGAGGLSQREILVALTRLREALRERDAGGITGE